LLGFDGFEEPLKKIKQVT